MASKSGSAIKMLKNLRRLLVYVVYINDSIICHCTVALYLTANMAFVDSITFS